MSHSRISLRPQTIQAWFAVGPHRKFSPQEVKFTLKEKWLYLILHPFKGLRFKLIYNRKYKLWLFYSLSSTFSTGNKIKVLKYKTNLCVCTCTLHWEAWKLSWRSWSELHLTELSFPDTPVLCSDWTATVELCEDRTSVWKSQCMEQLVTWCGPNINHSTSSPWQSPWSGSLGCLPNAGSQSLPCSPCLLVIRTMSQIGATV
jgi:hypothetical protein